MITTLIIGASGFIGRHLAEFLVTNQHTVVVSSRDPSKAEALLGKSYEYIAWDGINPEVLARELEKVDAVVNLAGENIGRLFWTSALKKRFLDSRVITGTALAEAFTLASRKPSVLIQGSATGIYGTKAFPSDGERRPAGSGFLAELTRQWESSVNILEEENSTRVVYIRTGLVLGRKSGLLAQLNIPFNLGMGVIPGSGRQYLPWIHIDDQVGAIRFLVENPATRGPYNLAAPNPVTMRQMVKTIGKIRKRPAWVSIPAPLLKLALGEMARETILSSQDVLPEALLDAGYSFQYVHLRDALENLLH